MTLWVQTQIWQCIVVDSLVLNSNISTWEMVVIMDIYLAILLESEVVLEHYIAMSFYLIKNLQICDIKIW